MPNRFLYLPGCLLVLVIVLFSCQPDSRESFDSVNQSPEEVLRAYQGYYDRNQFDEAKALSTPAEQERLDELAEIIAMEVSDSTVLETVFEDLDCSVQRDTARCICTLRDQYEQYQANFQLVRTQAGWLVDAPHEEQLRIDEELDRIMDSLLNNN